MNHARQLFEKHGPEAVAHIAVLAAAQAMKEDAPSTPPTSETAALNPATATPAAPASTPERS